VSSNFALPPEVFAQVTDAWARQDYGLGEQLLAEACRRHPGHQHLRTCHAAALGYCARFPAARAAFDELLRSAPPERKIHMHALLGIEWGRIGRHDLAAPLLRIAMEAGSAVAPVVQSLADALLRLRQNDEALAVLRAGLTQHPGHPGLLLIKARAERLGKDPERAAATARQVIASPIAADETKAEAGHELGHALDALHRHQEAFAAFQAAKFCLRPRAETFLPIWQARHQALCRLENQPERADYERWAAASAGGHPPLDGGLTFLTGVPRSGTTLLERVLDAHPGLVSAPETPVFSSMWNRYLRACPTTRGMRELLAALTPVELHSGRDCYWQDIEQAIEQPPAGRVILDKNPSAMPNVPAILRFFPEAKMLIALRDPRAVAWSCFTQYLPPNPETAAFNRFDTLGAHLAANYRFWLHSREQLPRGIWRECRYETLVSDFETEARDVLAFLGLPWDASVASHHTNPAPVRSPTYAEAAQPVYSRAVDNWRHYEEFMGDALTALTGVMPGLGYPL
jgi:tetratricopeptide (TPR) repeat protein